MQQAVQIGGRVLQSRHAYVQNQAAGGRHAHKRLSPSAAD
jgi:hypothetical protein